MGVGYATAIIGPDNFYDLCFNAVFMLRQTFMFIKGKGVP